MGPIERSIVTKLRQALIPIELQVLNESSMHNVPANSETHFKITVVSELFGDKRMVQRHQTIYKLLAQELDGPVHALAIHTFAPSEWEAKNSMTPTSPKCLGG
jgi:BolA protein